MCLTGRHFHGETEQAYLLRSASVVEARDLESITQIHQQIAHNQK